MMRRRQRPPTCYWCYRPLEPGGTVSDREATRDHYMPKSLGGQFAVKACWSCNNLRGAMPVDEWRAFIRDNPKWWTLRPRPGT